MNSLDPISLDDIPKLTRKWTLGKDSQLLKTLELIDAHFIQNSEKVLKNVHQLEYESTKELLQIDNLINRLDQVRNRQFVENRVFESDLLTFNDQDSLNELPESVAKQIIAIDAYEFIKNNFKPIIDRLKSEDYESIDRLLETFLAEKDETHAKLPPIIGSYEFHTEAVFIREEHLPGEVAAQLPNTDSSSDSRAEYESDEDVDLSPPSSSSEPEIPSTSGILHLNPSTHQASQLISSDFLPKLASLTNVQNSQTSNDLDDLVRQEQIQQVKTNLANIFLAKSKPIFDSDSDSEDDLFSTTAKPLKQSITQANSSVVSDAPKTIEKRNKSLFDESESDDELFGHTNVTVKSNVTIQPTNVSDFEVKPKSETFRSELFASTHGDDSSDDSSLDIFVSKKSNSKAVPIETKKHEPGPSSYVDLHGNDENARVEPRNSNVVAPVAGKEPEKAVNDGNFLPTSSIGRDVLRSTIVSGRPNSTFHSNTSESKRDLFANLKSASSNDSDSDSSDDPLAGAKQISSMANKLVFKNQLEALLGKKSSNVVAKVDKKGDDVSSNNQHTQVLPASTSIIVSSVSSGPTVSSASILPTVTAITPSKDVEITSSVLLNNSIMKSRPRPTPGRRPMSKVPATVSCVAKQKVENKENELFTKQRDHKPTKQDKLETKDVVLSGTESIASSNSSSIEPDVNKLSISAEPVLKPQPKKSKGLFDDSDDSDDDLFGAKKPEMIIKPNIVTSVKSEARVVTNVSQVMKPEASKVDQVPTTSVPQNKLFNDLSSDEDDLFSNKIKPVQSSANQSAPLSQSSTKKSLFEDSESDEDLFAPKK